MNLFAKYLRTIYTTLTISSAFFPLADQFLKIVKPTVNDKDGSLALFNTVICSFLLLTLFSFRNSIKNPAALTLFIFVTGILCFIGYRFTTGPIRAIMELGVNVNILQGTGFQNGIITTILYFGFFACLTSAFAIPAAKSYQDRARYSLF